MRPDKKKVRHHDSRKKAEEAKRKAADKGRGKPTPQSQPADVRGSQQNLEEGDRDRAASTSEFGKRNITSNWTKYEIPSSDDDESGGGQLNSDGEEDPDTGERYADVLAGAGGSASLLRLRAEREWEAERERDSAQFASDLFSLDLQRLEAAVSCVPLHQQLDIPEEDIDVSSIVTQNEAVKLKWSNDGERTFFSDSLDF